MTERETKRERSSPECDRNRVGEREIQYRMRQKQRGREGDTVQNVTETEMETGRYGTECDRKRDGEREVQYRM